MAQDRTTNSATGALRTRSVTNDRKVGWLRFFELNIHSRTLMRISGSV
jgi:hypothetical protein